MLYALLIYEAESARSGYSDEELEAALRGHREFQVEAKKRGAFVEANQLMSPVTATAVRVRSGETRVTDGPYIETKELLVGYYLMECADLDEAIQWAAGIPHAATGGIEIRPMVYLEQTDRAQRTWTSSE